MDPGLLCFWYVLGGQHLMCICDSAKHTTQQRFVARRTLWSVTPHIGGIVACPIGHEEPQLVGESRKYVLEFPFSHHTTDQRDQRDSFGHTWDPETP